jgi:hypothetical protein
VNVHTRDGRHGSELEHRPVECPLLLLLLQPCCSCVQQAAVADYEGCILQADTPIQAQLKGRQELQKGDLLTAANQRCVHNYAADIHRLHAQSNACEFAATTLGSPTVGSLYSMESASLNASRFSPTHLVQLRVVQPLIASRR